MKENGDRKYLDIVNSGGKRWLLPAGTLKAAMALYEPSAFNGKLLKRALPLVKNASFILKRFHIFEKRMEIEPEFDLLMQKLFFVEELEYAVFMGTPGEHQKITIQLYTKQKILGYCKISKKEDIIDSFYREAAFLTELKDRGLLNTPSVVFCGRYKEYGIFIQSTSKLFSSFTKHELSAEHLNFIKEFCKKTSVQIDFPSTEYYAMLQRFKEFLQGKSNQEVLILKNAIEIVELELSNVNRFSFYHGDFTPWNTYYTNSDNLCVFDFEYARHTYPVHIDLFHFFTQSELYRNNASAKAVFDGFKKYFYSKTFCDTFKNPEVQYLMYLIDIIHFYISRDQGRMDEETKRLQQIRIELVGLCCKNIQRP